MDVSQLMTDPDFAQSFTVLRRVETVNAKGLAEYAEQTIPAVGVIQPATPKELERLPEGDRYTETITVFTTMPLWCRDEQAGTAPDMIAWQGLYYEVTGLENWTGQGFYHALAQKVASWAL